jgi:hypothetical protein
LGMVTLDGLSEILMIREALRQAPAPRPPAGDRYAGTRP